MTGLGSAVAFLTRIPMPASATSGRALRWAPAWFPVVGAAIGVLAGGVVIVGFSVELPVWVAATVSVAVTLLATGALHEDGLADTFDGLGSRRSGEEAIAVMRDPNIGAFGTAALVISLLLQVATLASLGQSTVLRTAVAAHAASRGFAALTLHLNPASTTGLAATYNATIPRASKTLGFLVGIVIAVAALPGHWWVLPLALLIGGVVDWLAVRRLGGITGDVIGAVQQVTLITILVGATVRT